MAFTKVTAAGIGTTEPLVFTGVNLTGVATATGLYVTGVSTFTSNVSIAGTLTYEDVTNIDSVGLITARSGVSVTGGDLKVGSAVTISQDNIFTTGIITATTGSFSGTVTASSFSGSASGLTGINDTNYWGNTDAGIHTTRSVGVGTTNPETTLYVSGSSASAIQTLTDGATITPDFSAGNLFTVTLGGNRTLANPTNLVAGQSGAIFLVQDGTGSRTLSWGSYWDFPAGTAPTLTTTASAIDRVDYVVRSTTSIHTVFTANYS